jgi:RHS repeat-associated protein
MGRILKHTDPQGVLHEFFNDPAGDRLITQVSGSGSASTVVGRNDEWQRQGSYQGTHYRFDRAGNLTHKQDSQQRLELAWDANQRLIASRRTTKGAPPSVTTYGYDPLGRRLFKETQGQRTWFGWDGDAMTMDVIDGQAREFIYRPETFEPLAVLGQTAQSQQLGTLHYVNDPNGCPTRLIDGKGQVLWAASYSAWGAIDKLHASTVSNPIRLQGQYEDGETGLYYNRHRIYDCLVGCYISSDPIGQDAGESLYDFAPDTLQWVDPLGLTKCKPKKPKTKEKYITYKAKDLDHPGEIYVGRSSGPAHMTPLQILRKREAGHHRNLGPLQLDKVTDSYPAIRGREHALTGC